MSTIPALAPSRREGRDSRGKGRRQTRTTKQDGLVKGKYAPSKKTLGLELIASPDLLANNEWDDAAMSWRGSASSPNKQMIDEQNTAGDSSKTLSYSSLGGWGAAASAVDKPSKSKSLTAPKIRLLSASSRDTPSIRSKVADVAKQPTRKQKQATAAVAAQSDEQKVPPKQDKTHIMCEEDQTEERTEVKSELTTGPASDPTVCSEKRSDKLNERFKGAELTDQKQQDPTREPTKVKRSMRRFFGAKSLSTKSKSSRKIVRQQQGHVAIESEDEMGSDREDPSPRTITNFLRGRGSKNASSVKTSSPLSVTLKSLKGNGGDLASNESDSTELNTSHEIESTDLNTSRESDSSPGLTPTSASHPSQEAVTTAVDKAPASPSTKNLTSPAEVRERRAKAIIEQTLSVVSKKRAERVEELIRQRAEVERGQQHDLQQLQNMHCQGVEGGKERSKQAKRVSFNCAAGEATSDLAVVTSQPSMTPSLLSSRSSTPTMRDYFCKPTASSSVIHDEKTRSGVVSENGVAMPPVLQGVELATTTADSTLGSTLNTPTFSAPAVETSVERVVSSDSPTGVEELADFQEHPQAEEKTKEGESGDAEIRDMSTSTIVQARMLHPYEMKDDSYCLRSKNDDEATHKTINSDDTEKTTNTFNTSERKAFQKHRGVGLTGAVVSTEMESPNKDAHQEFLENITSSDLLCSGPDSLGWLCRCWNGEDTTKEGFKTVEDKKVETKRQVDNDVNVSHISTDSATFDASFDKAVDGSERKGSKDSSSPGPLFNDTWYKSEKEAVNEAAALDEGTSTRGNENFETANPSLSKVAKVELELNENIDQLRVTAQSETDCSVEVMSTTSEDNGGGILDDIITDEREDDLKVVTQSFSEAETSVEVMSKASEDAGEDLFENITPGDVERSSPSMLMDAPRLTGISNQQSEETDEGLRPPKITRNVHHKALFDYRDEIEDTKTIECDEMAADEISEVNMQYSHGDEEDEGDPIVISEVSQYSQNTDGDFIESECGNNISNSIIEQDETPVTQHHDHATLPSQEDSITTGHSTVDSTLNSTIGSCSDTAQPGCTIMGWMKDMNGVMDDVVDTIDDAINGRVDSIDLSDSESDEEEYRRRRRRRRRGRKDKNSRRYHRLREQRKRQIERAHQDRQHRSYPSGYEKKQIAEDDLSFSPEVAPADDHGIVVPSEGHFDDCEASRRYQVSFSPGTIPSEDQDEDTEPQDGPSQRENDDDSFNLIQSLGASPERKPKSSVSVAALVSALEGPRNNDAEHRTERDDLNSSCISNGGSRFERISRSLQHKSPSFRVLKRERSGW